MGLIWRLNTNMQAKGSRFKVAKWGSVEIYLIMEVKSCRPTLCLQLLTGLFESNQRT